MPPRITVTEEDILKHAFEIVRECGAGALNARALSKRIGCSTQPIFSNFKNMEELKGRVIERAYGLYGEYLAREMQREDEPKYKLSGLGYIRFAREERELFKLLFMRDRENEQAFYEDPTFEGILGILMRKYAFSREQALSFHAAMWVLVHGIASMIATNYLKWDEQTVSDILSKAFRGLTMSFKGDEKT